MTIEARLRRRERVIQEDKREALLHGEGHGVNVKFEMALVNPEEGELHVLIKNLDPIALEFLEGWITCAECDSLLPIRDEVAQLFPHPLVGVLQVFNMVIDDAEVFGNRLIGFWLKIEWDGLALGVAVSIQVIKGRVEV